MNDTNGNGDVEKCSNAVKIENVGHYQLAKEEELGWSVCLTSQQPFSLRKVIMIRDARGGGSKRKVSHIDLIHAFDMLRTGLQEENDMPQDCVYSLDRIQRIWQQTRSKRKKNSPTLTSFFKKT
jgi:hypothetical protein